MATERFADKVVWITGGGSGIGKAVAVEFARQGAAVAVSGRRADRLTEVVREIEARGHRGLAVECDVTSETSITEAVEHVVSSFGRLDVAVANAGFSVAGRIEDLSADDWRRQLETNVIGAAVTARHALPHLRKDGGRLALVGSVSGLLATPGFGAYSASKYALRAIGQTLSLELHGSGATCTLIQPGFVESDIVKVDNHGRYHADRADKRPAKLIWPAERAAVRMVGAIYHRRKEYVFTGHGRFGAFMGKHFPGISHFVMTRSGATNQVAKQLADGK